jgi:hypothetical protein
MSNMSYCLSVDSIKDLCDCFDRIDIDDVDSLSESEKLAKEHLIRICIDIANDYGDEV